MASNGNQVTAPERVNFGKINLMTEYPDLLEIQLQSFQEFFQLETTPENRGNEGLFRVFQENFPITDARNIFVLEFWIIISIHRDTPLRNVCSGD